MSQNATPAWQPGAVLAASGTAENSPQSPDPTLGSAMPNGERTKGDLGPLIECMVLLVGQSPPLAAARFHHISYSAALSVLLDTAQRPSPAVYRRITSTHS